MRVLVLDLLDGLLNIADALHLSLVGVKTPASRLWAAEIGGFAFGFHPGRTETCAVAAPRRLTAEDRTSRTSARTSSKLLFSGLFQ